MLRLVLLSAVLTPAASLPRWIAPLPAPVAAAQELRFDFPAAPSPPTIEGDRVVVAVLAVRDNRLSRASVARRDAEERGRSEALARLHQFIDQALAEGRVRPRLALAVHEAADRAAEVDGIRSLPTGDAVVRLAVPLQALRTVVPNLRFAPGERARRER
ncbi:MAG: hypothetical protein AAGF12_19110 [Myxococcota bacterium]